MTLTVDTTRDLILKFVQERHDAAIEFAKYEYYSPELEEHVRDPYTREVFYVNSSPTTTDKHYYPYYYYASDCYTTKLTNYHGTKRDLRIERYWDKVKHYRIRGGPEHLAWLNLQTVAALYGMDRLGEPSFDELGPEPRIAISFEISYNFLRGTGQVFARKAEKRSDIRTSWDQRKQITAQFSLVDLVDWTAKLHPIQISDLPSYLEKEDYADHCYYSRDTGEQEDEEDEEEWNDYDDDDDDDDDDYDDDEWNDDDED